MNGGAATPLSVERAYVDVDEWRERPSMHRYVHGGFADSETRFSFYLPPADQYGGRFFQHITPVPDDEHLAEQFDGGTEDKRSFAFASGAYFVETNGGGKATTLGGDPTIGAFAAHAAAAEFSRTVAAEMYGAHRPFGYAYGGSGGAYRTMGCMQNTTGVWDGFVPYVPGSPMAIPNMFTVRMQAMRVCRDKFPVIVDAFEPGGGGIDAALAALDDDEREAFSEVTRMGFPPRSWVSWQTMGQHAFPVLFGGIRMADPTYFEEFWTTPGYLGHDRPEAFAADRVQHSATVVGVIDRAEVESLGIETDDAPGRARGNVDTAFKDRSRQPAAIRVSSAPPVGIDLESADVFVRSGTAAGRSLSIRAIVGDVVLPAPGADAVLADLRPGDAIEIDNAAVLAVQSYHRHQVPGPEYRVWDQFRDADGDPLYPQRPLLLGPLFTQAASGSVPTGEIRGKVIIVSCLDDREAVPWHADWYRSRVEEYLGDQLDDRFRLWYVDRALHGDVGAQEHATHNVSYLGVLHQALRDVAAWAEEGTAPLPSTNYRLIDGQVVVPADAADRLGVQPTVTVTANGDERADISAGQTVHLHAVIAAPPGAGRIVRAEWDLDGSGAFATTVASSPPAERLEATVDISWAEPGTRFIALRAVLQRDGDPDSPFARIENLGRARVVVT